jgi:Holliday junction resolvase RusA-like endonuclease
MNTSLGSGDGLMPTTTQTPETQQSFLCWIVGTPVPQGSKTGKVIKGRAILYDDNAKVLKPWRKLAERTAAIAMARRTTLTGPLHVTLDFWLPRPASVKRARPSVKPDIDKLTRAIFDAMTAADVWEDDARVVSLTVNEWYADNTPAGVRVHAGSIA